jgi:hypothetical protein
VSRTDTCDERLVSKGRENSSASQSKHDVPGEVLIGTVSAPVEAINAVRVAKLDVLAHKNTRDECCVDDEMEETRRSKDAVGPFQHAFPPCLDSHLLSFCNFQPMTIPLPRMPVPYR